jgi:hypothetical protein
MFSLKNHPFAVEAFFESSLVLTFAIPKEKLFPLIPKCVTLDLFKDKWAFIAVAMVQTKNLRPKGFPTYIGNDFFLIGFRVFVRFTNSQGRHLRGLYIMKSETDKAKMSFFGNFFTHYHYTTTDILHKRKGNLMEVLSLKSGLNIQVDLSHGAGLPEGSPFENWKEARHYAGPLPFTFTFNEKTKEVLIIEGVRENWVPAPVAVINQQIGFMNRPDFKEAVLANAFIIENVPYFWKKGKIEIWNQ